MQRKSATSASRTALARLDEQQRRRKKTAGAPRYLPRPKDQTGPPTTRPHGTSSHIKGRNTGRGA